MNRAYGLLEIRSIDDDARIIEGLATSPEPDRVGDIVEPMGAKFTLPLPLLWQHDKNNPVGFVETAKKTKAGIPFRARIVKIDEPGALKDMVDKAWQAVKAGLVRGVSIGFRSIERSMLDGGGIRFQVWEWLELSLVTVPANADATISRIKSLDSALLVASGRSGVVRLLPPGASGQPKSRNTPKEGTDVKTFAEQIKDFEAKRAAKAGQMEAIMNKSVEESRTLEANEKEEHDTLRDEIKEIDEHLVRLQEAADAMKRKAVAVVGDDQKRASESRAGVIKVTSNVEKGTAFIRYAMAVGAGKGSISDTIEFAKRWESQTPEVLAYIKATAGQSQPGSGIWGSELVFQNNLAAEFIELLRPLTIIGRISGFRMIPFNVRIARQTGGSTVNWVGEMAPKPASELDFDTVQHGYNKIAGIVVLTEENVRLSSPSSEAVVRRDLTAGIAQFMDTQFLDPSVSVGANNPASITNGVSAVTATGSAADDLYADLNVALSAFDDSDTGVESIVILMRPKLARGISTLRNALGQFEFTGLSMAGGTLNGFPVIVSNSVPAGTIVILKADEVFLSDDGQVTLDASNQATLDMNGGSTPTFGLWQRNCVGIRAERWITWSKRRDNAVAMIESASYGPQQAS